MGDRNILLGTHAAFKAMQTIFQHLTQNPNLTFIQDFLKMIKEPDLPCCRRRFDVCFSFIGDESLPLVPNEESRELRWVPFEALLDLTVFDGHRLRIAKTLAGRF